jgi:hypothetical protein
VSFQLVQNGTLLGPAFTTFQDAQTFRGKTIAARGRHAGTTSSYTIVESLAEGVALTPAMLPKPLQ